MNQAIARELRRALAQEIKGDLLWDEMSRAIFSTDASLYQQKPIGIVQVRDPADILQSVRTAVKFGVQVLPRGGGTSLAGQTVTRGLVIDDSKYLTRILEIDPEGCWARIQPGIILDNLNHELISIGRFFAPDVATSSRATVGGMIGNNSAGTRSVRYGHTVDHILEMNIVLSSGEEMHLSELNSDQLEGKCQQSDREGEIYRTVRRLVRQNRDEIVKRYPDLPRRVAGYNLNKLLDEDHFNLASLVVGSEGTLAFVTEAKVNLEEVPLCRMICVLHFDNLKTSIDAVHHILRFNPTAVEIIDRYGLELATANSEASRLVEQFIQGNPEAVLMVEFSGQTNDEIRDSFKYLKSDPQISQMCYHIHEAWEGYEQAVVWAVRKNALGLLLGMKGDGKPLPFIEDSCVPVEHLSSYISDVLKLCEELGRPAAMYAHASVGLIHVRPILNLKKQEDVQILKEISERTFELVQKYGGVFSGEHGDGLVRSYSNPEFYGEKLMNVFREVKRVFDPKGLMNPGKILESHDIGTDLRIHPDYTTKVPSTHFHFRKDRGFERAVELCTGVGHCRKTLGGTMCPSYIATRDEEHSTRGRANALRMAMSGQLGPESLTSKRLYEVLDLCLECKACKTECPSNVDMARLKAEFLSGYYAKHGVPFGKRLVASTRKAAELGSRFPGLANLMMNNPVSRWFLSAIGGIHRKRSLPSLALQSCEDWFYSRKSSASSEGKAVTLFMDTFTNYYEPHIGRAAIKLLESLGHRVIFFSSGCCGRPLISSGYLKEAKRLAAQTVAQLGDVSGSSPIIVLEPSCLATLYDDFPDLLDDENVCREVTERIVSLEQFLIQPDIAQTLRTRMNKGPKRILLHGHCQNTALFGMGPASEALSYLEGTDLTVLDAGCCGMAGSFGYETEHYEISEQIGEDRLFPAVRGTDSETTIVASGFSCRAQISHFTGRKAVHLAEVLTEAMEEMSAR
jgi:FAD/FMN-containing dehydrogenase/Fe-S oxidoreductase